jgi:hypothetical protein
MNLSVHNNHTLLQNVDSLPTGPEWTCEIVTMHGNKVGQDGTMMMEDLELWKRDPVECIKESSIPGLGLLCPSVSIH